MHQHSVSFILLLVVLLALIAGWAMLRRGLSGKAAVKPTIHAYPVTAYRGRGVVHCFASQAGEPDYLNTTEVDPSYMPLTLCGKKAASYMPGAIMTCGECEREWKGMRHAGSARLSK